VALLPRNSARRSRGAAVLATVFTPVFAGEANLACLAVKPQT
jgi:hypothetical protein